MESIEKNTLVKLHPDVKEISFMHQYAIQNVFRQKSHNILGIHYLSLMIINADNLLTVYSTCPSLEFNMLDTTLWHYDGIFSTENHRNGEFFYWDDLYADCMKNTLIREKEKKYGFTFGFYLTRKINSHFVIYSFATKNQIDRVIYKESQPILKKIADYFYYALEGIHEKYTMTATKHFRDATCNLQLVVDNTKTWRE